MAEAVQQRIDAVLQRIRDLRATPARIVLTEADMAAFERDGEGTARYRGVPLARGQIGGSSYVEATGAPSGETNFGI
jgi:hypothetical protein